MDRCVASSGGHAAENNVCVCAVGSAHHQLPQKALPMENVSPQGLAVVASGTRSPWSQCQDTRPFRDPDVLLSKSSWGQR